jgi:hypothetical protein
MIRKVTVVVLGLLSMCTAALAVVSFFTPFGWKSDLCPQPPSYSLYIGDGLLEFYHARRLQESSYTDAIRSVHFLRASCEVRWGAAIGVQMDDPIVDTRLILLVEGYLPAWMLAVLFAAYPAFVWKRTITLRIILLGLVTLAVFEAVRLIVLLPELRMGREWAIGVSMHNNIAADVYTLDLVARDWAVPAVLVLLAILAFGPGSLRRYRMRHRECTGLCIKCGYDLTGNVSGTCPECGAEVKQP